MTEHPETFHAGTENTCKLFTEGSCPWNLWLPLFQPVLFTDAFTFNISTVLIVYVFDLFPFQSAALLSALFLLQENVFPSFRADRRDRKSNTSQQQNKCSAVTHSLATKGWTEKAPTC